MADEAKLNAVKNLRCYDHCFLNADGVADFARAFGVALKPYRAHANPDDHKGLRLNGGAKSGIGMDAAILAGAVCDLLDLKYETKFGRGSQLRVCCDALEQHFSN